MSKIYEQDNKIFKKHMKQYTFVKEINIINKIKNQEGFINHIDINKDYIVYDKMDGNIDRLAEYLDDYQILKTFLY